MNDSSTPASPSVSQISETVNSANFTRAFAFVVGIEGAYSNDKTDPGGETNWGISKRAYPALDIRNLSKDEAQAIYLRDYWAPCGAPLLPFAFALCVFDAAINQGLPRAIRWMQQAVGADDDGHIGDKTIAACNTKGRDVDALALFFFMIS